MNFMQQNTIICFNFVLVFQSQRRANWQLIKFFPHFSQSISFRNQNTIILYNPVETMVRSISGEITRIFFISLLGIIAFDNTLWSGKVLLPEDQADESTKALKRLNDKLAKDSLRSFVVQLNVGDGYTLAVKL